MEVNHALKQVKNNHAMSNLAQLTVLLEFGPLLLHALSLVEVEVKAVPERSQFLQNLEVLLAPSPKKYKLATLMPVLLIAL